jgi:DNA adenine methylase
MKNSKYPKPPLKWAGGKQRILSTLLPHIAGSGRLIEPFVGAGSVFMASGARDTVINDANADLIAFYRCLQRDVFGLIEAAEPMFSSAHMTAEAYLDNRLRFNAGGTEVERAALLLYLNRFGFNGLYRVNKQGKLNVPYGHPKSLPSFPHQALLDMATRLQGVQIICGDFKLPMALATAGDVVYCDPPYIDASSTKASFTAYTASSFGQAQQLELVKEARAAVARGATVVISNHDGEVARQLYQDAEIHSFDVRRSIAANGEARMPARELIAIFKPSASQFATSHQPATAPHSTYNIEAVASDVGKAADIKYVDVFKLSEMLNMPPTKTLAITKSAPWQLPPTAHFGKGFDILRWREHEVQRWMIETALPH